MHLHAIGEVERRLNKQIVMVSPALLSILQQSGLEIDRFGSSNGSLSGLEWS